MIGDDILYPDFMVFMILTLKTVLPKFTVTLLRGIFERDAVIQALQLESSKKAGLPSPISKFFLIQKCINQNEN